MRLPEQQRSQSCEPKREVSITETGQRDTEWEAWENPVKRKKSSSDEELRDSSNTRDVQVREATPDPEGPG